MDSPSNGVSIVGYLRPAFTEEESYLRSLFNGDDYSSDWKGTSITNSDMKHLPLFFSMLFFDPIPFLM
jgi:hypothetical protein